MKIDKRRRTITLPSQADIMLADDVRQALVDLHSRSTKRATLDVGQVESMDTAVMQVAASAARSFDELVIKGLEGKSFEAHLRQLTDSVA